MWNWLRGSGPPEAFTAVLLPEPLRAEVLGVVSRDGEVAAVRLVRQRTGLNLLPAVLAVRGALADAGGA